MEEVNLGDIEPEQEQEQKQETKLASQKELEYFCTEILDQDQGTTQLKITIQLNGDLDFDFLNNPSIPPKIHLLEFQPDGGITSLSNLPKDLEILNCPNNKVKSILGELPRKLKQIRLPKNQIGSLDLGETPSLELLDLTDNKLTSLTNLPASLKELYILRNPNLSLLDLENVHLDVFDYDQTNTSLVIKNADPDKLRKAYSGGVSKKPKKEEDTDQDDENQDEDKTNKKQKKISYQEALVKYFEYKSQYENSVKKWRKNMAEKKGAKSKQLPPCIKCKQAVGMTFQKDGTRYLAKCGIGKQYYCDFEIELNSGEYVDFLKEIQSVYHEFQENKQKLTKIKMENLFGYQEDSTTAKRFQEEMRTFKTNNRYLADLLERVQVFYGTDVQKTYQIENMEKDFANSKAEFQTFIEEYHKDPIASNQSLLDDAMEFYATKVRKQGIGLNREKFPVMEMNPISGGKEMGFVGGKEQTPERFYQSKVFADFYSFQMEKPEVITFQDS